jgi:hypothetical protein
MKQFPTWLCMFGALVLMPSVLVVQVGAQATYGSLTGTVFDSSGAAIAHANIVVTADATNASSKMTSSTDGIFTVPNLTPGTYTVSASAPAFNTEVVKNAVVSVQQTTRVDLVLKPGSVETQVSVNALPPIVQTTSSDLGEVINHQEAEKLPLNGRFFEQLVTIVPGTVSSGNSGSDSAEDPAAGGSVGNIEASVNGLPFQGEYVMIDGVHDSEPGNGYLTITPPLDSIDEFKVETANPQAEYGSFGGAIVNVTIKSGTNKLHGELFEFVRNNDFNARDYFALTKSPYHSNQFGGTLGGPIIKDKLFFFMDFQQLLQNAGSTFLISVPTQNMRNGILTGQTQAYNPQTGQPYQNNIITNINPIAQAVANIYPLPNLPGDVNNYDTNVVTSENLPQFDVKGDWWLTPKDHIFARETFAQRAYTSPSPGNRFLQGGPYSNSQNHAPAVGWDHIFSQNLLNDFRFGYMRFFLTEYGNDYGVNESNALGILNGNLPNLPDTSGIATFNIPGYYSTGDPGWVNSEHVTNEFQLGDVVTLIRGKHSIKAGMGYTFQTFVDTNPQDDPRGIFGFDSNVTSNQGANNTGNAFASFLIGDPSSVLRDLVTDTPRVVTQDVGPFVQDDWRVNQKLTLNVGFRWDLYTHPVEAFNKQANLILQTGLLQFASPGNRGPNVNNNLTNFGPRVGVAYSLDNSGRTAIRAAFGMSSFNDTFGANGGTLERNYPFFPIVNLVTPTPFTPFYSLNQGLPVPTLTPYSAGTIFDPPPGTNVFEINSNFKQDEAQVWNVSVQRQITNTVGMTVSYVGTHGSHIFRDLQLDQAAPGPGDLTTRLPFYSINPNLVNVDARNGTGDTHYNGLQAKVEGRLTGGFYFLGAYTYAKNTDDTDNLLDPYVPSLNTGLASLDIRNNAVLTYAYPLPFGRNQRFLNRGGFLSAVAGGWSLNGITTFQGGEPLHITTATSGLNNNGPANVPDLTCKVSYPKTVAEWFNTGCFANPALYTFGNAGNTPVRSPGLNNWDLSLAKDTSLRESLHLKIEAGFFNAWNHPHFGSPNSTFGTGSFGTITYDQLPPREIQLGAKLSF